MKKQFVILLICACIYAGMREKKPIESVAVIAIVGMYLVSAIDKLISISDNPMGGDDTERLKKKYSLSKAGKKISKLVDRFAGPVVIIGGLIEFAGSVGLLYGYFRGDKKIRQASVATLIVFTILATLMFYANPIVGYRALPIVSNINAMGGLLSLF